MEAYALPEITRLSFPGQLVIRFGKQERVEAGGGLLLRARAAVTRQAGGGRALPAEGSFRTEVALHQGAATPMGETPSGSAILLYG